jgi:hypothetical protein
MRARVPQGSVLSPTLNNLYINDTPQATGVNLALFADDTCLYATERKEDWILRNLQRALHSMAAWRKRWNIKSNAERARAIYFFHQITPSKTTLTLNVTFLL